mgnify:CR=1 FL=1
MSKLNWVYQDHASTPEYRAEYGGFVILAQHDSDAQNPFTDHDGHWPMMVNYGRRTTTYDKMPGTSLDAVLFRFTDAQLVHDQHGIAKVLGDELVWQLLENHCYGWDCWRLDENDSPIIPKHCTNGEALREAFGRALNDVPDSKMFDVLAELYGMLGVPALATTSTGYCQGDWAELLIVATPEAQAQLRPQPADTSDEAWAKELAGDMEQQAELYGHWAWGNVFGYVVCRAVPDADDPDETELVEIREGSCWGYYGDEFDKSGLEEAALDAIEHALHAGRAARTTKLAGLIRNRVPLHRRAALLAEAEEVAYV